VPATASTESCQTSISPERCNPKIELPHDDPILISEAGRVRTNPGSDTVETPRSGDSHCDLVLAVAAAVLEHESHRPPQPARTMSAVAPGRGGQRAPRFAARLPIARGEIVRDPFSGLWWTDQRDAATGLPAHTHQRREVAPEAEGPAVSRQ
jgi:hypothetical protein